MYQLYYTKEAQKDAKKLNASHLKLKIQELLELIENDPFANPPPFKKLKGILEGAYSRRINLQHRLFYQVDKVGKRIKVLRMWTHYGDN
jgi:Txe/YoeB family toxin of toxin-antitoxin system